MKLPSKIKVGRTWYAVQRVPEAAEYGYWRPIEKVLVIARKNSITGRRYTQAEQEDTFWHELTHAILHELGSHLLNRNESFVGGFASCLHGAVRSAKFDDAFDAEKWKRENL